MVQSNKRPLDNFGDPLSVSPDEIKVFAELIRLHKRKFADFLHNNLDFPEWDVSVESKFGMDGGKIVTTIFAGFFLKGGNTVNYPEYAIDMLTGDIYKSIGYFGMDKKAPLGNIATIKDSFWGDNKNPLPISGYMKKSTQIGELFNKGPVKISDILSTT